MKIENKLKAFWSKREMDLMIHYPLGSGTSRDGHYISSLFNDQFIEELKARGYDITTIKFEVKVKPELRPDKFDTLLKLNQKP